VFTLSLRVVHEFNPGASSAMTARIGRLAKAAIPVVRIKNVRRERLGFATNVIMACMKIKFGERLLSLIQCEIFRKKANQSCVFPITRSFGKVAPVAPEELKKYELKKT
jgi:hypothetical protein